MTEEYGIIEAKVNILTSALLVVPHRNGPLTLAYPAFGPNTFDQNVAEMQKVYVHSPKIPKISFREPTTSELVSAVAYNFKKLAKPQILSPKWLQAGRIVKLNDGLFVNPPRNQAGELILDESELKESLKRMKKIKVGNGHIYLGKNDIGFAEYETFQIGGLQDSETFAKGGLARIIEHTKGPAIKLELISALSNYPRGISVEGFESSRVPIERVLNLSWESDWSVGGSRLYVDDISRSSGGYAFGVRK